MLKLFTAAKARKSQRAVAFKTNTAVLFFIIDLSLNFPTMVLENFSD
jgi:hypothetical protein